MTSVGFVGLGRLGAPIAGRLLAAGFPLAVYDTDAAAVEALRARGATACSSAREVGDAASIVFLCLPSVEVSVATARELAQGSACELLVETSTIGRPGIERIAAVLAGSRVSLVDCPVSGGQAGALEGRLAALVAAAPEHVERLRPLLASFASKVFVLGSQPGLAQVCKLVNNVLSLTGLVVACEAIVVGVKAGLDAATMIDVVNASTGRNSATMEKFPRAILPRNFDSGGAMAIGIKDLGLFLEEAQAQSASAVSVAGSADLVARAAQRFGTQADMTNLIRLVEELAGLDAQGRAPCQ